MRPTLSWEITEMMRKKIMIRSSLFLSVLTCPGFFYPAVCTRKLPHSPKPTASLFVSLPPYQTQLTTHMNTHTQAHRFTHKHACTDMHRCPHAL